MKTKGLVAAAVLALAGCTTVGPGGQMQRDPTGRAIWSFVFPGLGQFMNNEAGKGVLMMGANIASYRAIGASETYEEARTWWAVGLAVEVWSTADAYRAANRLNVEQPLRRTYRSSEAPAGRTLEESCGPAPAEPRATPTVCLDLLNKRLLASMSYRF